MRSGVMCKVFVCIDMANQAGCFACVQVISEANLRVSGYSFYFLAKKVKNDIAFQISNGEFSYNHV
jgi:hypothetical protein